MRITALILTIVIATALLPGCVERRYIVYTDPPSAIVLRNGERLGPAPVDDHFVYYGKYDFTLVADGYETQHVMQDIRPPWWEWPGIDFFSENLIPWRIVDRRVFQYKLEPRRIVSSDELLKDAQNLRNRGNSVGANPPVPPPLPASVKKPADVMQAQGSGESP